MQNMHFYLLFLSYVIFKISLSINYKDHKSGTVRGATLLASLITLACSVGAFITILLHDYGILK